MSIYFDYYIRLHGTADQLRGVKKILAKQIDDYPDHNSNDSWSWGKLPKITGNSTSAEFWFSECRGAHIGYFCKELKRATKRNRLQAAAILSTTSDGFVNSILSLIENGQHEEIAEFPCELESIDSALTLNNLEISPSPQIVVDCLSLLLSTNLTERSECEWDDLIRARTFVVAITKALSENPCLMDDDALQKALSAASRRIQEFIGVNEFYKFKQPEMKVLLAYCEKADLDQCVKAPGGSRAGRL